MADLDKKEDYLELIKEQIRCKKVKDVIAEEINQHIEDQKDSYRNEGYDENTALVKSLEEMGDPVEIGRSMNKIHKPRLEWKVLLAALVLCFIGTLVQINMNNSPVLKSPILELNTTKRIILVLIGVLLMSMGYFLDYSIIGKYPKAIWTLVTISILIYIPFGKWINGQMAYLNAYSLIFIPVYGGILFAYRKKGYIGIVKCLFFSLSAFIIVSKLIAPTSVFLCLIFSNLLMLSAAVKKNWFNTSKSKAYAIIWGWIPAACFMKMLTLSQYQIADIYTKLDIMLHPGLYDKGYLMNAVRQIIANSKLFGRASDVSMEYLPGYNNDYILTYVIGKWGIIAGIFIIILFLAFVVHMFRISINQKKSLGMFVSLGCSLVFTLQGSIYILSNLSIQIVSQVNLPFVSYGGTGLLINFIILGIMLSVFRYTNIVKEEPYKKQFIIKIESVK